MRKKVISFSLEDIFQFHRNPERKKISTSRLVQCKSTTELPLESNENIVLSEQSGKIICCARELRESGDESERFERNFMLRQRYLRYLTT